MYTPSAMQVLIPILLIGIVVWTIMAYNRLIALRNRFKNAFAQIDVQLTRRHDLIPNLVEIAKGYMGHERQTLEAVISARNQAHAAVKQAADHPEDPAAIQALRGAEGSLSGVLSQLFALVESYPDLKANQTMIQLSEEFSATENRVAFARQAFNDAVMHYNIAYESFPANLIANWFRFKPGQLLVIEDVRKSQVPQASFA